MQPIPNSRSEAPRKREVPGLPGAPDAKSANGHYGIDPQRAALVAEFLRNPSVVQVVEASLANSTKGIKFRLKARRFRLWKRLVIQMERAQLKPVSWGYFLMLTAGRQYELLTVDNCCCATCRDLGFVNYNEMRIIAEADAAFLKTTNGTMSLPGKAEKLQRIDKEEGRLRSKLLVGRRTSEPPPQHVLP